MKENTWYEHWFDSPYYHLLYENRNEAEASSFIEKLVEFLQIPPKAEVLDVACGKGRHSRTLAKFGLNVTGIDLSKNNIEAARAKADSLIHFEVWDMRKTYRKEHFDFLFNLFSSFGYFDNDLDDEACIHAFYESLKPGGILILDYMNTEYAVKNMTNREIIPRGEVHFHIQKRLENGFIKKKIEFLVNGENYSFEEQLKVINQNKFVDMLQSNRFKLKNIFGDYLLHPFKPASSPRLILVAEKI